MQSPDPRVRRTRTLLHQSLARLLESKEFSKISVQDVAEAATLNRATFYAHYPDKFALLECMVGSRFDELLNERGIAFDGSCTSALKAIILAVFDFLAGAPHCASTRRGQMEPHLETAIISVIRRMILSGLERHPSSSALSPEITATTASWAIYGAAIQWLCTPGRCASEAMAEPVVTVISRILEPVPVKCKSE